MRAGLGELGHGHPQRRDATVQGGGASVGGEVIGGGGGERRETDGADISDKVALSGPASSLPVPHQSVGISVQVGV